MGGFAETCSVVVSNSYNTCGTLTKANLATLSPAQIQELFQPGGKWGEMQSYLKHVLEMKACGIRRSPLYDWIMSSNRPGQGRLVNVQRVSRGPSLVAPFILGKQQSVVNTDHWYITANVAANAQYAADKILEDSPDPGYTGGTAGNRIITVKSTYAASFTPHKDYFLPGKRIHMISKTSGGAWSPTQFLIVQAGKNGTDGIDVEVKLDQATTSKLPTNPTATTGLVFTGINNVADVEAWCRNMVNTNSTKLVPFWYQTRRWQRCIDSEYRKMFAKLMEENAWFSLFVELPLAERNRQDEIRDQKEFMHAFFFGEAISDNQSLTAWQNLEKIYSLAAGTDPGQTRVDPGTGGFLQAYRAHMIGVVPQLHSCTRFDDAAGQNLEIKDFLETQIYEVYRARESQGRPATEIDIYTDQGSADEFMVAFIAYSKEKLGDIVRLNIDEGTTTLGFPFRRYKLYKPHGVFVNIVTDAYFDDLVAASAMGAPGPAYPGLGKFLMTLDLGQGGTIYPAVLGSNRKQYTVGEIDKLAQIDKTFSCAMENPTIDRTLTSTTTTAVVECPLNSRVDANFLKIVHTPATS